jgi:hypothetical protein
MAKLLTLLNVLIMPKNYCVDINEYLHTDEIKCKCSFNTCHYTIVAHKTIEAFYNTRMAFGQVLRVNSFYRCQKHNEAVGGSKTSSHTTGLAVDISTRTLTGKEKEKLQAIARENFDFVKVYETFIHCQLNPEAKVASNG